MYTAMITNYPNDGQPLGEYALHLNHGLQQVNVKLQVISSYHNQSRNGELRSWRFGDPRAPLQIIRALQNIKAEKVFFNTSFTCWGNSTANMAMLMLPLLLKSRMQVTTLLHDLPQTVDIAKTGYKFTAFHHLAIWMATRSLLTSDSLVVTLERNEKFLRTQRGTAKIHRIHHGLLGEPVWKSLTGNQRVLILGKFGRAKDPTEVVQLYYRGLVPGTLAIAGKSLTPGFLDSLSSTYPSSNIHFLGYVDENLVPSVFHGSDLVLMPYKENVGASGVLLQACQYGRPIVARRTNYFQQEAEQLGLAIHFYNTPTELRELLHSLLPQKQLLEQQGRQNFEAVQHLRMEEIAIRYKEILT